MQLSRIDLNLFAVFDAIYRERGITAAARQLHLSQPAVSHALARLRELLGDPLFERQGNVMIPTPMARTMAGTVHAALGGLDRMLRQVGQFDPASSQRLFKVASSGSAELSFLPDLVERLAREAPGIQVATVRADRGHLEEDLRSGELDLALDIVLPLTAEIRRQPIGASELVVLARAGHPVIGPGFDMDAYLAQEHVLVTGRRRGVGLEDVALGRLGMQRQIRVRCQRHGAARAIVARTDLLATMSRTQAVLDDAHAGIQVLALPVALPALETFLYWHASADADPASQWFRAAMLQALRA
ncbi:MAG: LysR family transcriptional regulator [Pseudorhodoferax sp.]